MSAFSEAARQFELDYPGCTTYVREGANAWTLVHHSSHIMEGASYNTDEPNSYENNQGVYVSLICQRCRKEAEYVPASNGQHERYWVLKTNPAESLAKATGATRVTYTEERRNADGTLTETTRHTYER